MPTKRLLHYDYIRVFALVSIIAIHSTDILSLQNNISGYQWWLKTMLQIVIRAGLPVFLMISGALLLNGKKESLRNFYLKRFSKIVIPLVIYSLIYLFIFNFRWQIFQPIIFLSAIKTILAGPVYFHLWFVYLIVGIYTVAPFLKVMVVNLTDKMLFSFMLILILARAIAIYLPIIGITVGISSWVFDGWIMYFLLGYALTRESLLRYYKIIYILGLISFIATILILRYFPLKASANIYDLSPTMIFIATTIFYVFEKNKTRINLKQYGVRLFNFIAIYSYSIYLMHGFALHEVGGRLIKNLNYNYFLLLLITVVFTFLLSIFLAIIIDNIIKFIKYLTISLFRQSKIKFLFKPGTS